MRNLGAGQAQKGNKMFYVYCINATDEKGRFYIGSTNDLRRRLKEHNTDANRSTKNHQWRLVYYEAYITENAARQREQKLKQHGNTKQALMKRIKSSLTSDGFTQL